MHKPICTCGKAGCPTNIITSAVSLWGFMLNDPSVPKDEREAAQRLYNAGQKLLP